MSALDLLKLHPDIDFDALAPLQRILLTTDGTLTDVLEASFLEPIELRKLSEKDFKAGESYAELASGPQDILTEREILLRGAKSQRTYVYAKSILAIGRLPPLMQQQLKSTSVPLGRLWLEHRLETFKELTGFDVGAADESRIHFGSERSTRLFRRSYRVVSGGRTVMLISEHFPDTHEAL
jgi:chorismate-pyruvate lyase